MPGAGEEQAIANGRGKWSYKGIPHKGWRCVEIEDLGSPSMICEMCEGQEIRYVHYMQHDDYKDVLGVGCVCAGHMEEDLTAAKLRDNFMVSRVAKRRRWLTRQWKMSQRGNEWIEVDGYRVTIYEKNRRWSAVVSSIDGTFEQWSRRLYDSPNQIKLAAFDVITKRLSLTM